MKKILLSLIMLVVFGINGFSQCDKKVTYTASHAAMSDIGSNVKDTLREKITVQTSKTSVKLTHNDKEDDALSGEVTDFSCQWKDSFTNGISVLKCSLSEPNGNKSTATLTIEGKAGKILITLDMQHLDGGAKKFEIFVDSYSIQE
jgi:hypothetical protein